MDFTLQHISNKIFNSCFKLLPFPDSGVNATYKGRPYLGATIGNPKFLRKFIGEHVMKCDPV